MYTGDFPLMYIVSCHLDADCKWGSARSIPNGCPHSDDIKAYIVTKKMQQK